MDRDKDHGCVVRPHFGRNPPSLTSQKTKQSVMYCGRKHALLDLHIPSPALRSLNSHGTGN